MIEKYFNPVASPNIDQASFSENNWQQYIKVFEESFPALEHIDIAFFTIFDDDKDAGGAKKLREYIYSLQKWEQPLRMADLGQLKVDEKPMPFDALTEVVSFLIEKEVVPVFIGQDHALTYSLYKAYVELSKRVNLTVIDERIDAERDEEVNNTSFLNHILFEEPGEILNFSHLGYQSYFVPPELLVRLEEQHFDSYRLGIIRDAITEIEPVVRDTDLLSFDIGAVRQSDAPGRHRATPNGLYAEEACQISRYAGLSENLRCFGLFGFDERYDRDGQTAQLLSQMLWYFVDGCCHRQVEKPRSGTTDYLKYNVDIEEAAHKVVFWKSNRSGRWWMEVPFPTRTNDKSAPHLMPCSYTDYKRACEGELPERWLKTYQRLSYFEE